MGTIMRARHTGLHVPKQHRRSPGWLLDLTGHGRPPLWMRERSSDGRFSQ